MVDFAKLKRERQQRERDARRTTTTDPHSRAQVFRNQQHRASIAAAPAYRPTVEAITNDMAIEENWESLLARADACGDYRKGESRS
jgi:hypothetical protein